MYRIHIFIIIIIIIACIILYIYKQSKTETVKEFEKYKNIRSTFKTGDIILFSCKKHETISDKLEYFCRTKLLGSEFGHVGIIVRHKHDLFLLECTNAMHPGDEHAYHYSNQRKGGVRLINFDILLKEYHKNYNAIYAIKHISEEISNSQIFEATKEFKEKIFEDKKMLFFLAFVDILISHDVAIYLSEKFGNNNRVMCSEFVHKTLHNCNILNEYTSKIFWPHLFENQTFNNLEKNIYTKPYYFVL